jgi:RHS repeat-associated protein
VTYDNDGNLIYKSQNGIQTSYLWDALGRFSDVYYTDNESVVRHQKYLYNGDGERVYVIADGSLTGFLYDAGRLIAEYNASGKVFAQYIHGSGLGGDVGSLLFAQKLIGSGEETSVETSYYFHNWRGDVVAVTDESGNPLDTYRYSAFGEVIEQSGASDNDILFSSKRYHGATALSYFGARYYDASIGRFISRDPLGYIDGPNQYIYCANNPINLIDPYGLSKRDKDPENSSQNPPDGNPPGNDVEAVLNQEVALQYEMIMGYPVVVMTSAGPMIYYAGTSNNLIMFQHHNTSEKDDKKGATKYDSIKKQVGNTKEGIYEFIDTDGLKYVGQSKDILKRLMQHIKKGFLDPNADVNVTEVLGAKTNREIAEYNRLKQITGNVRVGLSDVVSNINDPICPKRQHLLNNPNYQLLKD